MWPKYWDELTDRQSTEHVAARELLNSSRRIHVPSDFSERDLAAAEDQLASDARLRYAVATGACITQALAGGPELVTRYQNADEYGKKIAHAALDAKRFGGWLHPTKEFLRGAALGYLSERALGKTDDAGGWFDTAFERLTEECHGTEGILAPRRVLASVRASKGYQLADYLEQQILLSLPAIYPSASFWDAVTDACTETVALREFSRFAASCGRFLREAMLLYVAADRGDTAALSELAQRREYIGDHAGAERLLSESANRGHQALDRPDQLGLTREQGSRR